jgi:VanZ family protein
VGNALTPTARAVSAALLAAVGLIVGVVTLSSGAPAPSLQGSLIQYLDRGHAKGTVPGFVTYDLLQWLSNVVMFVPVGALLAAVLLPRQRMLAAVISMATSGAIELIQHIGVPGRVASFSDVLANTTGALLGVLVLVAGTRPRLGSRLRMLPAAESA